METLKAIFIASGDSEFVLKLADEQPSETLLQRTVKGEPLPDSDQRAVTNSVIIRLSTAKADDARVLDDVSSWLDQNRSLIKKCSDQKLLEFNMFIDSNTGSQTLAIPHTLVRLCADLGLNVATQATRELTSAECADIFSRNPDTA
jgi:hypothetical protein